MAHFRNQISDVPLLNLQTLNSYLDKLHQFFSSSAFYEKYLLTFQNSSDNFKMENIREIRDNEFNAEHRRKTVNRDPKR